MKPRHRRVLARWAQAAYQASERRVSRLVLIQRSTLRYQGHRDRQEGLRFFSLEDAQQKLEQWQQDYNRARPHSALRDQAPETFAAAWSRSASPTQSSLLEVLS